MPLETGKLDKRVMFERATVTENSHGDEVPTWAEIGGVGKGKRWAQVFWGRGSERRQAAQEQASVTATFRVRADSLTKAVTETDRLMFEGAAWDITSNVPFERDGRDVTAVLNR